MGENLLWRTHARASPSLILLTLGRCQAILRAPGVLLSPEVSQMLIFENPRVDFRKCTQCFFIFLCNLDPSFARMNVSFSRITAFILENERLILLTDRHRHRFACPNRKHCSGPMPLSKAQRHAAPRLKSKVSKLTSLDTNFKFMSFTSKDSFFSCRIFAHEWRDSLPHPPIPQCPSPYVPSGHRVFHVTCARERGFTGKQSHFATRGSVNPTGHLVIGPTIIKTYPSTHAQMKINKRSKSNGRWNHT
jgi:hypothetical protein